MEEKLCLVTGASSGIGQALAISLAKSGYRLIASARTPSKAQSAKEAIVQATGSEKVETLIVDLGDFDSVRAAVGEFGKRHGHLDVLCNIAGATYWEREETEAGIEKNLAVNHLGPFLLTNLLLDALKAAPEGRVVNVVGEYHRKVSLDLDDLQWQKRKYSVMQSGSAAMLMRVMFTKELARRLEGTSVTSNCFHPGPVRTNLTKNFPPFYRVLMGLIKLFFISPRKGADTGFWLATSKEAGKYNGEYFVKRKRVAASAEACDVEKAARFWEVSAKMLDLS